MQAGDAGLLRHRPAQHPVAAVHDVENLGAAKLLQFPGRPSHLHMKKRLVRLRLSRKLGLLAKACDGVAVNAKAAHVEKLGAFARPALRQIIRQLHAVAVRVALGDQSGSPRTIASVSVSAATAPRNNSRVAITSSASRSRLVAGAALSAISFSARMP